MAYDKGLAELLRTDLADHAGIEEKKMFGGLAFMLNGNMLLYQINIIIIGKIVMLNVKTK